MAYLLDSNVFIEAKKNYYQFGFCPGFWDWLIQGNASGKILSHTSVFKELTGYGDELSTWARKHKSKFFIEMNSDKALKTVATWVAGQTFTERAFTERAMRDFLDVADYKLVACGLAYGHTVVSHEVHIEGERKRVKIPTVCQALKIPYMTTFQMLAAENAVFDLRRRSHSTQRPLLCEKCGELAL